MSSNIELSVIVPCYNEEKFLEKSINQLLLLKNDIDKLEIIIVNDSSTDNSAKIAKNLENSYNCIRFISHSINQGKGAAIRTGFEHARGEVVCIHDADLEYDPQDLLPMLNLIQNNKADAVFGTRFSNNKAHRVLYFWHSVANKVITLTCNIFTDLNLTDIECCYKMFKREVIKQINIEENRFGVEPELVSKTAHINKKKEIRIFETSVSYYGRTYAEGKKIGFKDAIRAFWVILKYNTWHK